MNGIETGPRIPETPGQPGPPGPLVLGIETSCDETAAAVVDAFTHVKSNIIATQHDLHRQYAGVVPEIASREHLQRILPVVREAIARAGITLSDLDAIAVSNRPGLIGSLLVGVSAAKALAWSLGIPIIGVDHIVAHLYAGLLDEASANFPAIGLVVSGGHTSIFSLQSPTEAQLLGKTIDDAVGEAYDKTATILGLGYPGGPALDKLATQGNDRAHELPIAQLGRESLDFSFSGLKTAMLYAIRGQPKKQGKSRVFERDESELSPQQKADFAASFQRAAVTAIIRKLNNALDRYDIETLLVGGGVSANSRLRIELTELAEKRNLELRLPNMKYCMDNAAMIAGLASVKFKKQAYDDWTLTASPRMEFAAAGRIKA